MEFLPGETRNCVILSITDDDNVELDERFTLSLESMFDVIPSPTVTVTIENDDCKYWQ